MKTTAIVLAAGSGKRVGTSIKKQYLEIGALPVVAYSLLAFQQSRLVDEIILVTGKQETGYCREQIVLPLHLDKVTKIIPGGKERYDSVYEGLKACEDTAYVLIHDGARPFITEEMIERLLKDAVLREAAIAAVPVKDTIKIAAADGCIDTTPDRRLVWQAQTPQTFRYELIRSAYEAALKAGAEGITDDASCVERYTEKKVYLTMGSYENIKITTPEDLILAGRLAPQYRSLDSAQNTHNI